MLVVPPTPVKKPWTIVTTSVVDIIPLSILAVTTDWTSSAMSGFAGRTPTGHTPHANANCLNTDSSWEKTMMSAFGLKRANSNAALPVLVITIGLEFISPTSLLALAAMA